MEAVLASCGNGLRLSTQRDQSRALDEQCAIVVPSNHRRSLYKRHGHADEKRATLLSSVCFSQSSSTEGSAATTHLAGVVVASRHAATDRAANASGAGPSPGKARRLLLATRVEAQLLTSRGACAAVLRRG